MPIQKKKPVPVICYHSVALSKNKNRHSGIMTLELKYFEDHLKYLTGRKYRSIFLDEYYAVEKGEQSHPKDQRAVCLTFDDGCLDNWIYVFPLLKKYHMKATIFVSPEFVDTRNPVRKNLEAHWNNEAALAEIDRWGFLSWEEMRIMEKSGLVDIQSHTLSHTKYFISDKLTGFHRPRAVPLYAIANRHPHRKPYYIEDPQFEKLLPYGSPLFEEESAITARRVFINEDFNRDVVEKLANTDWRSAYDFPALFKKIEPLYKEYKEQGKLIVGKESEAEYRDRVGREISFAKEIIEKELNKKVEFCCWPHGDNNEYAHRKALETGHLATTGRQEECAPDDYSRIIRFGLKPCKNNRFLSLLKTNYKVKSFQGVFPYRLIDRIYNRIRYGKGT
ncbi:MAG: polysaccharide deacetylase family protein [Candidatus Aminicenantes bacterium]|nr:polysaccharide deacetylase family protein [Candidatus Aminicenantes bacterium]